MEKEQVQQLLDWVKQGGSWVAEQAPDVIQQLLRWKLAENIAWMFIGVLLLIFFVWFSVKSFGESDWIGESEGAAIIPWGTSGVLGFLVTFSHLFNILQIYFAPKVFLIEYLSKMLKG